MLALVSATGFTQTLVLTEESAVQLALSENLFLTEERVGLATSARNADTAWNALLPSLTVSGSLVRSNEEIATQPPSDPYNTTFSTQLDAQLVFSLASVEGIQTARLRYVADQISYDAAAREIDRDVRKLFYNVILLEEQILVTDQSITTAEETLEQARIDFAGGRVPELDVRRAEVSLANLRLLRQRQVTGYEDTVANVRLLLGIEEEIPLVFSGSIQTDLRSDLARVVDEQGISQRLDLLSLEAQIVAQRSLNRAERQLAWTPSLAFGASYNPNLADPFNPGNAANDDWSEWSDRGSLSVSISIPLDNYLPFSATAVDIEAGDDSLHALEIRRESVLESARSEVSSLLRQIESSGTAIDSLRLSVDLAEEIYDLTVESYQQGATDFLDVQEAEDDLSAARYDLLSERYVYLSSLIDLEFAINAPLR